MTKSQYLSILWAQAAVLSAVLFALSDNPASTIIVALFGTVALLFQAHCHREALKEFSSRESGRNG